METLVNEYLLAFSIKGSIRNAIKIIKNKFKDDYGCTHAAQLTPHCTLMNFVQTQRAENHLVRAFDSILSPFLPIKIDLNNFDRYPFHTIYVKIEHSKEIKEIVDALKLRFKSLEAEIKPIKQVYMSDPHITIARGMTPSQFNLAWAEWQERKFASTFYAHEVILLKRAVSVKDFKPMENYQNVRDFKLTGQVTAQQQFTLF